MEKGKGKEKVAKRGRKAKRKADNSDEPNGTQAKGVRKRSKVREGKAIEEIQVANGSNQKQKKKQGVEIPPTLPSLLHFGDPARPSPALAFDPLRSQSSLTASPSTSNVANADLAPAIRSTAAPTASSAPVADQPPRWAGAWTPWNGPMASFATHEPAVESVEKVAVAIESVLAGRVVDEETLQNMKQKSKEKAVVFTGAVSREGGVEMEVDSEAAVPIVAPVPTRVDPAVVPANRKEDEMVDSLALTVSHRSKWVPDRLYLLPKRLHQRAIPPRPFSNRVR